MVMNSLVAHVDGKFCNLATVRRTLVRGKENLVQFTNPNKWRPGE
jgi:hypothetical protein